MRKLQFKFPKLCLSTVLIEIGILCALVAVNTRPMSYGPSSQTPNLSIQLQGVTIPTLPLPTATTPRTSGYDGPGLHSQVYDENSVLIKHTFLGDADLDGDTDLNDLGLWSNPRVANYGWPLRSVEIASESREVHYVHKKRLAANLAICLAIVVGSAIAIEWSIRCGKRRRNL